MAPIFHVHRSRGISDVGGLCGCLRVVRSSEIIGETDSTRKYERDLFLPASSQSLSMTSAKRQAYCQMASPREHFEQDIYWQRVACAYRAIISKRLPRREWSLS